MKKLKAFSFVEMLITLGVMSIVMLIATQTLNTVFKVSTMTQLKTMTKNEVSFAMDLTEKLLANSNVVDVYIYDTDQIRYYDEETGEIYSELSQDDLEIEYANSLSTGLTGTEIHIRPYGYNFWVCLGYFKEEEDSSTGYFVKRTRITLPNGHMSCFDTDDDLDDYPVLVLNSENVNVNYFQVSYIKSSDINNVFYVDMQMEPSTWIPGDSATVEKSVFRQAIVTTQGLTWY